MAENLGEMVTYAALLLHAAGKDITPENLLEILKSVVPSDKQNEAEALAKYFVETVGNIDEAIKEAEEEIAKGFTVSVAAAAPTTQESGSSEEEKKEDKEDKKGGEDAAAGLSALFG